MPDKLKSKALYKVELLVLAIIIQLFFNIFTNAFDVGNDLFGKAFEIPVELVIFLNIIFSVISIYLIICILILSNKEKELFALQNEMKHNENLLTFLKELKHDVNNQLFVVNGLLQLGKVNEAAQYSKNINHQFQWMEELLELNQPEVASLILNKLLEAKNQDIAVEVSVKAKSVPKISSEIFTRTIGNLLDNAIEALVPKSADSKKLTVEVASASGYLIIRVGNTGEIPVDISENIFERGFTTKHTKDGHGLGLHIVQSLMQSIGGQILHESKKGMTYFELKFPS